jgi:hypothetical protein
MVNKMDSDLALILAQACVSSQTKKADYLPELRGLRSQFESSTAKERALRSYAKDLEDLASRRSIEEDRSLGGYVDTAAKRLAPIPQTFGEATWRLPAIGLAGVGGYIGGQQLEETDPVGLNKLRTIDPDALHSVMTDAATNPDGKNQLLKILQGHNEQHNPGLDSGTLQKNLSELAREAPTDVAAILQEHSALPLNGKQKSLKELLSATLGGEQHIPMMRSQIMNQIGKGEKSPGPLAELMPEFKPYRVGGALTGLAMGSAMTGIPLALRALWQKHQGGEAAVRARNKMRTAIEQAEAEQKSREGLLSGAGIK